jgi:hypothetical protein
MNQYRFETKYSIGDNIYHATPESDKGIIVDIQYNVLTGLVRYNIVFGTRVK